MPLTFVCGFECGVLGSGLHFVNNTGPPTFSTSTVRSGARSLRCNTTGGQQNAAFNPIPSAAVRHVARFYVRFATLPSADCSLYIFAVNAAAPQVRFKQSDSKIYAAVGTTLGATGVAVTTGVWYRIDADFNINTSGADFCDVQVDGVACGQATGTGVSSGSGDALLGVCDNCTAEVFFDDVAVSDTGADYPIGAGYVNHFIPTSDGTHNVAGAADFRRSATATDITNATTDAYQLIDDVPLKSGTVSEYINLIAPPNATDYVEVVFGPAPGISTPTVAPRAVEALISKAKGTGTGANNLRIALNDNGSLDDVFNGDTTTASPTASFARKFYRDPPSAASAWTLSGNGNFNNVRMRCFTNDAAPDPWWASAMIEAEFAPPADALDPSAYGRPGGQRGQNQMKQLLAT